MVVSQLAGSLAGVWEGDELCSGVGVDFGEGAGDVALSGEFKHPTRRMSGSRITTIPTSTPKACGPSLAELESPASDARRCLPCPVVPNKTIPPANPLIKA
jgi:hypothetical protein